MLLKVFIILWIDIGNQNPQDADFLKMRNPYNWTHSKEDVLKNRQGNKRGVKKDTYSEKTKQRRKQVFKSYNLRPKMGFATSQVFSKPWLTNWSGT